MVEKICDSCGERVDEAKAFCPGCGNAFVDEEVRQDVSDFDKLNRTEMLSKTMYNNMLSEMGLNISKTPEAIKDEIRSEMLPPVTATHVKPFSPPQQLPKKSYLMWIIIGAVAAIFLLILLLGVAGFLFYYYFDRIT